MNLSTIQDLNRGVPDDIISFELPEYLKITDGAVGRLQGPGNGLSKAEKSLDYYRVMTYLNNDWRLIRCKDGIQWILQKRRGSEWKGQWFVRTKSGLLRGLNRCGEITPEASSLIEALPEWLCEQDTAAR